MSNWREFFEAHGDYNIHANYYECDTAFTVEELYAAIKARLQFEACEHQARNEEYEA